MIEFTTSKGSFIAVPKHGNAFDFKISNCLGNSILYYSYDNTDGQAIVPIPTGEWEIIGLSSDILKDEELASKVCDCGLLTLETHEFKLVCDKHNITGNQLIIKKK